MFSCKKCCAEENGEAIVKVDQVSTSKKSPPSQNKKEDQLLNRAPEEDDADRDEPPATGRSAQGQDHGGVPGEEDVWRCLDEIDVHTAHIERMMLETNSLFPAMKGKAPRTT